MKDELISIKQAAKILGVSPKTLRRWEAKGILTPQRTIGNQRRYSLFEIQILKRNGPQEVIVPIPLIKPQPEPTLSQSFVKTAEIKQDEDLFKKNASIQLLEKADQNHGQS